MAANISDLSSTIAHNVGRLSKIFSSNDLPDPCWDGEIPTSIQQDSQYAGFRMATLDACKKLIAVLQDPFQVITRSTPAEMAYIHAICQFNIATNFPNDQNTVSYSELADLCKMPEPELRRIVRGAMASYVFREEEGRIAHTPTSKFLATNPLIRQWVEMTASEIIPAQTRAVDAMVKWPHSEEPNQTGYNIANNTDDTAFVHMAKTPGRSERFANAMTLFSLGPGLSPKHALSGFDWASIGKATIVDIGGSHGQVTIPVVQAFPNISCIVQDLPDTINAAPQLPELGDRLTFMAHDFFTEQPVHGAEVYFLRWILHDWSDKYAIKILQALIPALKDGSRVFIMDSILPEPSEVPSPDQRQARLFDMAMRALQNGREREAQDWRALFQKADTRFEVRGMKTWKESDLGVIELIWRP